MSKRQRHDLDFYQTSREAVEHLLDGLHLPKETLIMEPCNGHSAISSVFEERGHKVWTNDVDPGKPADTHVDAARLVYPDRHPAMIVTNPPFNQAIGILANAVMAGVPVAMLLRLTFTEPVRERAEWLAKHPMAAHWTLPRYRWRQDTKGTDWATCAWMIWPSPGAPVAYGHLGHGVLLKRRPIVTIPRKDAASR